MFSFLALRRQPATVRRSPADLNRTNDDDLVTACGWFDSSHDLRQGLLAIELLAGDPQPATLALEICVVG